MASLIVLVIATAVFSRFKRAREAVRFGLAAMFLFTAVSHFVPSISRDLAAMLPPPLTGNMWIIWITGILEAAGAIGLMTQRYHRMAAFWLILFLVAAFPANVYAAVRQVPLRGSPPSDLWWRTPLQLLWIAALGWSSRLMKRKPMVSEER